MYPEYLMVGSDQDGLGILPGVAVADPIIGIAKEIVGNIPLVGGIFGGRKTWREEKYDPGEDVRFIAGSCPQAATFAKAMAGASPQVWDYLHKEAVRLGFRHLALASADQNADRFAFYVFERSCNPGRHPYTRQAVQIADAIQREAELREDRRRPRNGRPPKRRRKPRPKPKPKARLIVKVTPADVRAVGLPPWRKRKGQKMTAKISRVLAGAINRRQRRRETTRYDRKVIDHALARGEPPKPEAPGLELEKVLPPVAGGVAGLLLAGPIGALAGAGAGLLLTR